MRIYSVLGIIAWIDDEICDDQAHQPLGRRRHGRAGFPQSSQLVALSNSQIFCLFRCDDRTSVLLLLRLDLRPTIPQRHGAVEHQVAGRRIGVEGEIAEPLELDRLAGFNVCDARLHMAIFEHCQRLLI